MMAPIGEDIENTNDGNSIDMDDSVGGASASAVETMMREALEALRRKREHPDQPLPGDDTENQPPVPTKIDITSNGNDDVDDTSSSSGSETRTGRKHSSAAAALSRSPWSKCGKGTLFSLLSVLIAIVCILAIAFSLSGGGNGSSVSNNKNSTDVATEEQRDNTDSNVVPTNHDSSSDSSNLPTEMVPEDEQNLAEESFNEQPTAPLLDECNMPCSQDTDCHDPTNGFGLDEACGDLMCISGVCQFEAWDNSAPCAANNYIYCRGDDARCIRGPRDLSYEGTCTGYNNEECIYRWCPSTRSRDPDPVSTSPSPEDSDTVAEPVSVGNTDTNPGAGEPNTGECGTPCTQNSDCHDPLNAHGMDQDCGSLSCVSGMCQFEAWKDTEECFSTNFVMCSGDNTLCSKGPSELVHEGSCTGFADIVCMYQWCLA